MALIQDHGCKYLFQLARSDNPSVLYMALRVISTMFETMRKYLKLQQELFLTFTIDRLAPPPPTKSQLAMLASPRTGSPVIGSPNPSMTSFAESASENVGPTRPSVAPARGETRELMLETLSHIARHPSFMTDLFVNYDCDVNCEDLFERLIEFLTKVNAHRSSLMIVYLCVICLQGRIFLADSRHTRCISAGITVNVFGSLA